MLSRQQAWEKLNELVKNRNLIKHCLCAEAAMVFYAKKQNLPPEEQEQWGVAGLLHDADWEKYPDKHPNVIIKWLTETNQSEELINAIASHGFLFGVEPKTRMATTLRAVDELTGLIVAVALVKGKQLSNVTADSVRKKWKDKTFARGVNRQDIERGAAELGIPLEEHIQTVLTSLQNISRELGL